MIYLAAQFARQAEMRGYRDILRGMGIWVSSTWIDEVDADDGNTAHYPLYASRDLFDINQSKTLVTFTDPIERRRTRQSKNVEFGYALSLQLNMILIGPRENIFHHLPCVVQYDNFDQWIQILKEQIEKITLGSPCLL